METFSTANETVSWLLEPADAGVRYLALRDLLDAPADGADLLKSRREAHTDGPIAKVLAAMQPEGWWEKPGPGYGPKYRSTVWAVSLLGQLGARFEEDERVKTAAFYMLDHALTRYGQFSHNGAPGGTISCLQGNLCRALIDVGVEDARLDQAFDWMARSVTGESIAPLSEKKAEIRYNAYLCGPGFLCGANYDTPCAWGAVKIMLAFGRLPRSRWTPEIRKAVQMGQEFIFSVDPASAAYPTGTDPKPPNSSWWKFGFPVFYITDILQLVEAALCTAAEYDTRLDHALEVIRGRMDERGRMNLEYDYTGKTWGNFGPKRMPNKWVTLRAMRVFKLADDLKCGRVIFQ